MRNGCESYYAYLVECRDGTYYAGWTADLVRRLRAHNGEIPGGAKYTRTRRPVILRWSMAFGTESEARKCECALKRMRRKDKERLIHCTAKVI